MTERELESLMGTGRLPALTKRTIVSVSKLAKVCAQVKARGFASDDAEFDEGIRCVAAPIRNEDGVVIGSIGISAPLTRFPDSRLTTYGRQVVNTANQITEALLAQAVS